MRREKSKFALHENGIKFYIVIRYCNFLLVVARIIINERYIMRETKNHKFFIQINTIKVHAQAILNRLRKQNNATHIVPAISLILEGEQCDNSLPSAEIIILNSLLHHPEQYIKNIDPQVKDAIHADIIEILKDFVGEFNNDSALSMRAPIF